jgi:3-oxoacyl-[acyl-carrier protein] reductase
MPAQVALVTGAGQGVGRAIARTLAAAGQAVVVNDLFAERADRVADEIRAEGGTAIAHAADITDRGKVDAMVARAERELGPVDVLVNNAGIVNERRTGELGLPLFHESDAESWRKIVELNLFGTMNCTQAVLGDMVDRRSGRIISIISEAGRVGEARMAVYSGAKAAIFGFSKALAREVGPHGIGVNVVALAAISHEKPMAGFLSSDATPQTDETLRKVLRQYPLGQGLGRLARPSDAAGAVAFLASDDAAYITGQCIAVNGGFAMA